MVAADPTARSSVVLAGVGVGAGEVGLGDGDDDGVGPDGVVVFAGCSSTVADGIGA